MFTHRARRPRPAPDRSTDGSLDRGGYPGLEGDFESERRRAASATGTSVPPYEHGEGERPVLPVTTPGLTHP
ncbi:hypothetical protein K2F54_15460 [Cryobacterium sp. 1639]|uniref:hypothetical protein n=1 Tax=Cryobacterium inferilacus TaxID=2866629 RepID=UPI001C73D6CF|nr:hypothetical protein [Cryobacterium sp. 1639]MBX0301371.1 hypothetical protein [Cryobacterium sp. 1639]